MIDMNTRYGAAVGLIKGNMVYLSRRSEKLPFGKKWQFVNGRLNSNETGQSCALRVVKEQTGIDLTKDQLYFINSVSIDDTKEFYYIYLVHLDLDEMPFCVENNFRSGWRLFKLEHACALDLVPGIRHILRKLFKSYEKIESEKMEESIRETMECSQTEFCGSEFNCT
jgi:ADP-ribose pyrophosphatase YjhB (NUDIX family)